MALNATPVKAFAHFDDGRPRFLFGRFANAEDAEYMVQVYSLREGVEWAEWQFDDGMTRCIQTYSKGRRAPLETYTTGHGPRR